MGFITFYGSLNHTLSVKADEVSYEESLELPKADVDQDTIKNKLTITAYSTSRPSSINDYKKLGYKNIRYSSWAGYKIVASSRAKAFAKYGITNLLNLIPGWQIKAAIGLYDIISLMKSPEAYVYPTVNMQNIIATSPRGTEVLIGQNTITKVYSNSARTKLVKTISRTYWIG